MTALPVKRDRKADVAAILEESDRAMVGILHAAQDATMIDGTEEEPPPGWDRRRFRMARDFRASTQDAPIYIKVASQQVDAMRRKDEQAKVEINIIQQVILPPKYSDEEEAEVKIIDVEEQQK